MKNPNDLSDLLRDYPTWMIEEYLAYRQAREQDEYLSRVQRNMDAFAKIVSERLGVEVRALGGTLIVPQK